MWRKHGTVVWFRSEGGISMAEAALMRHNELTEAQVGLYH